MSLHARVTALLAAAAAASASCVLPGTMGAYVAHSAGAWGFNESFPTPQLGELVKAFGGPPRGSLPTACEVLVKVMASSVNPCDKPPTDGARLPKVMGSDIAGTVVALGPAAGCSARLKVGDKVWADIGANAFTALGHRKTKILGGYGEYALAIETQLGLMPKNIGFMEGGGIPKVALTSYKALVWYAKAPWKAAPNVLILGGSGGTGTMAIQMAKALGAGNVTTTTSSDNFAYCKGLGADQLIDYKTTNWWEVIAPDSYDVVYDCVGQMGTGDRAMKVIRSGGHYVTITGAMPMRKKAGVSADEFINSDTNLDNLKQLDAIKALVESEQVRLKHIDSVFGLETVASGFARSETHQVVGKVIVSISNDTDITC